MISSGIKYTGKVTVKIKNKPPVKVKNNGTNSLFNLIYDLLSVGNSYTEIEDCVGRAPGYMSLIHTGNTDATYDSLVEQLSKNSSYMKLISNSVVIQPMPIEQSTIQIQDTEVVPPTKNIKFVSLLTYDNVYRSLLISQAQEANDTQTTPNCLLLLLDKNKQNVLAYVGMSLSEFAPVVETGRGQQAIIEWEMSFSNNND